MYKQTTFNLHFAILTVLIFLPFNLLAQNPCINTWVQYVDLDSGSGIIAPHHLFAASPQGESYLGGLFMGQLRSGSLVLEDSRTSPTASFQDVGFFGFSPQGQAEWTVQEYQGIANFSAVASDAEGNLLFTVVKRSKTVEFGGYTLQFEREGGYYLAKFDKNKTLLNLTALATYDSNNGINVFSTITTDGNNNIYFYGSFRGNVLFDTIEASTSTSNNIDIFLAKYNSDGKIQWLTHGGSNSQFILPSAMAIDSEGNIIGASNFNGNLNINGVIINNLSMFGGANAVITKYSPQGQLLWARHAGNSLQVGAGPVATSGTDIIISGSFNNQLLYNSDTIIKGPGGNFLLLLDKDGDVKWSQIIKGKGSISSITTLDDGQTLVLGSFEDTSEVFGQQLISTIQNAEYKYNGFIALLNASGGLVHIGQLSSSVNAYFSQAVKLENNDLLLLGSFQQDANLGGQLFNSTAFRSYFIWRTCVNEIIKVTSSGNIANKQVAKIKAFPNPCHHYVNLQFFEPGQYEIKITTITGQQMELSNISITQNNLLHPISTSHLKNGFYLITIKSPDGYVQNVKLNKTSDF